MPTTKIEKITAPTFHPVTANLSLLLMAMSGQLIYYHYSLCQIRDRSLVKKLDTLNNKQHDRQCVYTQELLDLP